MKRDDLVRRFVAAWVGYFGFMPSRKLVDKLKERLRIRNL